MIAPTLPQRMNTSFLERPRLEYFDWQGYWRSTAVNYASPIIGQSKLVYCRETKFPPKGEYRANPFIISEKSSTNVPETMICLRRTDYYDYSLGRWVFNVLRPKTKVVGDLAAFCDSRFSPPDFTHPAQVYDHNRIMLNLQKAYSKVSMPQADVALMLAEIKQTISMIINPFKFLTKTLTKKVLRGPRKGRSKAKMLSFMTNNWLQYRYGILPLISDVQSLIDLSIGCVQKWENMLYRTKHWEVLSDQEIPRTFEEAEIGFGGFWVRSHRGGSISTQVTSRVFYRPLQDIQNIGMSMLDVPNLIWELTPFSFVFDWWLDVGTWLRALIPDPRFNILTNTIGTTTKTSYDRIVDVATITSWDEGTAGTSVFSYQGKQFTRFVDTPLEHLLVPNWSFESLTHVADSLSLIWQQVANKLIKR